MQEIKTKIQELFKLAEILSDYKNPDWIKNHDKAINDMTAKMDELKILAKANNTILGRAIFIPHADGNALYVVTKINIRTVRLDWCPWVDNWQDDVLGAGRTLNTNWVLNKIQWREKLDELFSNTSFNKANPNL